MTTDPKALIEQLEQEAACNDHAGLPKAAAFYRNCAQALRDLTAENERLTEQRDFLGAQAADLALKVGRLKALGDGLAKAAREARETFLFYEQSHLAKKTLDGDAKAYRNSQMADKMSAALAAWETK